MSKLRLIEARPTRERLVELDPLTGSIRYRIHVYADWVAGYCESFHKEKTALLLEACDPDTGKLIGALPLEIQLVQNESGWTMRQLVPLAGGQSDFVPFLCLPGWETEFARSVVDWLAEHRQSYELLRMNVIPQSSGVWKEFISALGESGFSPNVTQDRFFYKVNTDGRWEDYEKNYLHRRLDTVRNLQNQLVRDVGPKEVRILESGIGDHLRELLVWYRQRRKTKEQKDAFENYPERLSFLESVIRDFEPKKLVRLSILLGGGEVLAYQLDWVDQGIWYYYMPVFNDRFAKYSPSKILLFETMKLAFQDPMIHEFNFMRGEEPYKAQFADDQEAYISIRVPNPGSFRYSAITFLSRFGALRRRISR